MKIENRTAYSPEPLLGKLAEGLDTDGLSVEIKHCRGSQPWTGTCYWNRRLIRVRVNPGNRYPCAVPFATGQYLDRYQRGGYQYWSQRLQRVEFTTAEELLGGGFLHELSHYLDYQAGRNPRWKQTRADKFALAMLEQHRIGRFI